MLSRTMNPYTKEVQEYVSLNTKYLKHLPVLFFSESFFFTCNKTSVKVFLRPTSDLTELNPQTVQKNAAGKIIIVYDEDERIARQAATIMCERGIENLFMLSGGKVSLKLSSLPPLKVT